MAQITITVWGNNITKGVITRLSYGCWAVYKHYYYVWARAPYEGPPCNYYESYERSLVTNNHEI